MVEAPKITSKITVFIDLDDFGFSKKKLRFLTRYRKM